MGKIGPKISSCITGLSHSTSVRMVGEIFRSAGSIWAPKATEPLESSPTSRWKWRWLTILGRSSLASGALVYIRRISAIRASISSCSRLRSTST